MIRALLFLALALFGPAAAAQTVFPAMTDGMMMGMEGLTVGGLTPCALNLNFNNFDGPDPPGCSFYAVSAFH